MYGPAAALRVLCKTRPAKAAENPLPSRAIPDDHAGLHATISIREGGGAMSHAVQGERRKSVVRETSHYARAREAMTIKPE
jgi:hypothetical protein